MKVITYLAFTMLSIAIQFVVMDIIQAQMKTDDGETTGKIDLNNTSPKERFSDILQQYMQRPHAFYYHAPNAKLIEKSSTTAALPYINSSMANISLETSTESTSTLSDLFYDENTTNMEDIFKTSTEPVYTITELDLDNITEITFFNKKNKTEVKPTTKPRKVSTDCSCNLLYKVCDINCCCDSDCTETQRKIFTCDESAFEKANSNICSSQFSFLIGSNINDLLCVVKTNLPDKRNINNIKHDPAILQKHYKWHSNSKLNSYKVFAKKYYKYGDPIWVLRNGSIYYFDIPTPMINSYCSERRPITFLKEVQIKCIVKLTDLEIFQVLSTADQTSVISVTENSLNNLALDCSSLHCTNWTTIRCSELNCTNYNKTLHDPLCTDTICTGLALKIAYIFHYYENKIMNATIKLYTQNVPLTIPFIEQEVSVRFVVANESVDRIIEYSGNPGYISGLPVIVSYSKNNHTESFYSDTSKFKKYLPYPENINGICARPNMTNKNVVSFGINKRIKCRILYVPTSIHQNATNICANIQMKINNLLKLQNIVISPLGNPYGLTDKDWIPLMNNTSEELIYGELNGQKTKLYCYNLITRFSLVFTYAKATELKVLSARIQAKGNNVTINMEDMAAVVTFDTSFIDETKPSVYEYAGGPQLNIYLPRDFFFPYSSNRACPFTYRNYLLVLVCLSKLIK